MDCLLASFSTFFNFNLSSFGSEKVARIQCALFLYPFEFDTFNYKTLQNWMCSEVLGLYGDSYLLVSILAFHFLQGGVP